jgi:hypothetical protein
MQVIIAAQMRKKGRPTGGHVEHAETKSHYKVFVLDQTIT